MPKTPLRMLKGAIEIESDSTSIAASNERVVQELRSIVSKLRPEDSAQVESMLSVSRNVCEGDSCSCRILHVGARSPRK